MRRNSAGMLLVSTVFLIHAGVADSKHTPASRVQYPTLEQQLARLRRLGYGETAAQAAPPAGTQEAPATPQSLPQSQPEPQLTPQDLSVTVSKSLVLDSAVNIQRVSVSNGELAQALAVTPREVLVNGKAPGETSLIVWEQTGTRRIYNLHVIASTAKLDGVRRQIANEMAGQDISIGLEDDTVFLRGTAKDLVNAERAMAMASTLGKTVNLLRVNVPATESQILLKVRFANVDRAATSELGFNFLSTGAGNTPGRITTQAFSPPSVAQVAKNAEFTLTDALNIFFFRPDLNLGATIKALQSRSLLEILAEPNLLTISGKTASFLAGGEFPFPTLQGGGGGVGQVTIQFREFGVRIQFLPNITPRGTIRLQVTPEVSSLDYANGLVFQGFTVPGLATRRVQTEIEIESGQSFVIGGLLDNRVTETLSKIPGLGSIPMFGKLFQSRAINKNNTELLVMVTAELVRPIPADRPLPQVKMPEPFLKDTAAGAPRTPGLDQTGPAPAATDRETIPVEELLDIQKKQGGASSIPSPSMPLPVPAAVPAAPLPMPPATSPSSSKVAK